MFYVHLYVFSDFGEMFLMSPEEVSLRNLEILNGITHNGSGVKIKDNNW